MDKTEQIKLAAKLLGWTVEKATKNCTSKPDADALYFCEKIKGGVSLLMAPDGSALFAHSVVSPAEHLKAFIEGKRTPLEAFLNK